MRLTATFLLLFLFHPLVTAAGLDNRFGMEFIEIPVGSFMMGTEDLGAIADEMVGESVGEVGDEQPLHKVTLSKAFWLGRTEVTQSQWLAVMGRRIGPSEFWQRPDWHDLPVLGVSWNDARMFIDELNRIETQHSYRLPTEAEWEYAARAGSSGIRPFPRNELSKRAWYIENSGDKPQPVAGKPANAWGLFDMLGNAWEWVADNYSPTYYAKSPLIDPKGPVTSAKRIRRGGSFHCPRHLLRPGYRGADTPDTAYSVTGFRLVMEAGD